MEVLRIWDRNMETWGIVNINTQEVQLEALEGAGRQIWSRTPVRRQRQKTESEIK